MVKVVVDNGEVEVFPNGLYACDEKEADLDIDEVIKAFRDNGFNVTRQAIEHNFNAWDSDYKSGYLDEKNGYFLFTPCGCNQLRFSAEKINGKEYQKTYEC